MDRPRDLPDNCSGSSEPPGIRPRKALGTGRDRRRSARWSTRIPGQIEVPGFRIRLGVRVLDWSAGGARLELNQAYGQLQTADDLPANVVLALPVDRVDVQCAVRWRKGRSFGIEFVSAFAHRPRAARA